MPRDLISRDEPLVLRPVRPNVGTQVRYRARVDRLVGEMHRSLVRWILAAWRAQEPEIVALAADASPASVMRAMMKKLARRWQGRFDEAAPELADWFAEDVDERSQAALKGILRRGGFSVRFRRSRAVNDALQATVGENVALIRSVAQQHLSEVEGMVMRSVTRGRDLASLTEELEDRFALTRRRAALISRDQNNKATATIQRVRQLDLGITQARWIHSAGGRTPRPSHVKAGKDRTVYDVREGWYDPDEGRKILPGELINCRCVAAPLIPGLDG